MTMLAFELTPLFTAATWLLDILLRTSVQGGLVIGFVWLACRLVPRIPPGLRAGLWWLACLKLLIGLAWIEPVTLPVLPSTAITPVVRESPATSVHRGEGLATSYAPVTGASAPELDSIPRTSSWRTGWPVIVIVGLWLTWVLARLARLARSRRQCRALIARSTPVSDDAAAIFEHLCTQVSPPQRPILRLSSDVSVPQVIGAHRPVILLPSDLRIRVSDEELSMVICHELMHVVRRDLWFGWIPALAHDLFFFHPLAALAAREYRFAREAACDAAVIQRFHGEAQTYGRLLVSLGVGKRIASLAATCSSASAQQLKRRLSMLQHLPERSRRDWWWCVPVVLLIGVIAPVQLIAKRNPVTPAVMASSVEALAQPLVVLQPVPVTPTIMANSAGTQGDDRNLYKRWVFLRSGDAASMNGSTEDLRRAKTFQRHPGDRLIWFRKGSEEYVIRDSAILAAVEEAYRPLDKLGDEQAKLGEQQGQLGNQQGALGYKQSVHGGEQAKLGGKQAEISARMQEAMTKQARTAAYARERSGTAASAAQQRDAERLAERLMEELTREQEAVSQRQEVLGRQQEALGQEQEALGQKQAELGSIQEELGRKQEEAARQAYGALIEIMKNAITNGTAQKVR